MIGESRELKREKILCARPARKSVIKEETFWGRRIVGKGAKRKKEMATMLSNY